MKITNKNIIIITIISIILLYMYNKNITIYHNSYMRFKLNNNKIKVLTYNIQRIPIYFRPKIDIHNLMKKYDIVCLQENFCNLISSNKQSYGYNCVIPMGKFYKLFDSGLSIYSLYPIRYIDFVEFNCSSLIDSSGSKGFLIVQINDFILINTHLQASLSIYLDYTDIAFNQLKMILSYIKKHNFHKVLICGDFNLNLNTLKPDDNYNVITTKEPTHYADYYSYFGLKTSATYLENLNGYFYDGGLYKNMIIKNIETVIDDIYSDHKGVMFEIISFN
jgi:exonuclease III